MKYLPTLLILLFLTSCTYTITLVHTEGQATDVVDDTNTPTATVTPTVNIPASVIP
jgi:hypothetical protein